MNKSLKLTKTAALDRLLWWGGVGLCVWLAVLVIGAGAQSLRMSGRAAAAIREYKRMQTVASETPPEASDRMQKLRKNNLFVPAPTRAQTLQTQAILGNAVLIGDQWYTEGQEVQGFQIVKIGPDYVTVSTDGKEQRMVPFDVEVKYGQADQSGGSGDRRSDRDRGDDRSRRGGPPSMNEGRPPDRSGGFGPPGMDMRARIESMTPEQRRETFERFRNASPEERERMREDFMRGRDR